MKIKTKVLTSFLKKFRMGGMQKIEECVMRFEKDGLHIDANSSSKQSRSTGWLKTSAFLEYEVFGNIGVNDLSNVVSVMDRFDDEIQINKQGNLLTIIGNKKSVEIELVSEDFLGNAGTTPNLEFVEEFNINALRLKEIFRDAELNKNVLITIQTTEKAVAFRNTGKYKFFTELEAITCVGGCKATFGQPLIDSLIYLEGMLLMSLKNDYPCKVVETGEHSKITIICAPVVSEE
jgi:hypothetical protein